MKSNAIKWVAGCLAAVAAGVLLDAFILEKYFFQLKEHDIGDKSGDKKIRVVLLTDLHFKRFLMPHYHKLAALVNDLEPDLLLIAGDTLDSTGTVGPMERFFQLLDPHLNKAAIPGNNDYRADASMDKIRAVYEKYDCRFLVNETQVYSIRGERLVVTGLDDGIEGESDVQAAIEGIGREAHHILLVHSPLQQETAMTKIKKLNQSRELSERLNVSYIFAGHNHGGQIRLPGYVPVLPPKSGDYVDGWYNDEKPYLYVSRGFGTSSLPFRFWARSEVTLFNYYV